MLDANAQNPHITKVHIKGYKSLRDTVCTFSPNINIVIGENGSGKTNLVESIEQFLNDKFIPFDLNNMLLKSFFWRSENDSNGNRSQYKLLEEKIESYMEKGIAKIEKTPKQNPLLNTIFLISFNLPEKNVFCTKQETILYKKISDDNLSYFSWLGISFFNNAIKKEEKNQFTDFLNNEYFIKLQNSLKNYAPIQDIQFDEKRIDRIEHDNGDIEFQNVRILFKINGKWLTWDQLSDGTKRIYYVFSELVSSLIFFNSICILEEPELGIHPDQLFKLLAFIKENFQNRQIIITTHSPQVLNILNENQLDNIIITKYDNEKRTTVMHHISDETKQTAQQYLANEGFLSDFWLHHDLEEKEVWQ